MTDCFPPITAKKSYQDGHIALAIRLKCDGWRSSRARIDASTDLTIVQARVLAAELIAAADKEDAKIAAKAAAEARRKAWRDREIAAGRLKVMTLQEVFGGR